MSSKEIIGTQIGRPESPAVELHMQDMISNGLKCLLATKGLYQKVQVDLSGLSQFVPKERVILFRHAIEALQEEFLLRPWVPISRRPGGNIELARQSRIIEISGQPVGITVKERNVNFYLPSYQASCPICGHGTTFASLVGSHCERDGSGFPRIHTKGRQQLWSLFYQCELCHKHSTAVMVKRTGDLLIVCGRSERQPPPVPASIPRDLALIVEDAISAENEGDLFGAIYHLRTFLEHYMKDCTSTQLEEQTNGDALSDKYKTMLDARMNTGFPSLGPIYTGLSASLHTRRGTREDFAKALKDIDAHIRAKTLFKEFKT